MATRTVNRNIEEDHGASDASLWASAYLSNFFEDVENPSPRPQRQCRSFHHESLNNLGSSHRRHSHHTTDSGDDPFRRSCGPTSAQCQQKPFVALASSMPRPPFEAADGAPPRRPGRRRRSTIDSPADFISVADRYLNQQSRTRYKNKSSNKSAHKQSNSRDDLQDFLAAPTQPMKPKDHLGEGKDRRSRAPRRRSTIDVPSFDEHVQRVQRSTIHSPASINAQLGGDTVSRQRNQNKSHGSHRLTKSFHGATPIRMAGLKSEHTVPKKSAHKQSNSCDDLQDFLATARGNPQPMKPKDHLGVGKVRRSGAPRRRSTIDDPSFDEHIRRVHFSNIPIDIQISLSAKEKKGRMMAALAKPDPLEYSDARNNNKHPAGRYHPRSYRISKSASPQTQSKSPISFDKQGLSRLPDLPFCPKIGDIASPQDLIIETDKSKALQSIKALKVHDFAWVRRSDDTWTYGIIANFPVVSGRHATIRFVVDRNGSTKTVKAHKWVTCIRLVKEVESCSQSGSDHSNSTQHATEELTEQLRKEEWMDHLRNEMKRKKDKSNYRHS